MSHTANPVEIRVINMNEYLITFASLKNLDSHFSIEFIGVFDISFLVSIMMFSMFAIVPNMQICSIRKGSYELKLCRNYANYLLDNVHIFFVARLLFNDKNTQLAGYSE